MRYGWQVGNWLQRAQQRMQQGNELVPPDDSALSYYRKVLERRPENRLAKQAVQDMFEAHIREARKALRENNADAFHQNVADVHLIDPDNEQVKVMEKRFEEMNAPAPASSPAAGRAGGRRGAGSCRRRSPRRNRRSRRRGPRIRPVSEPCSMVAG